MRRHFIRAAIAIGLGLGLAGCGNGGPSRGVMPPAQPVTLADVQTQVFTPSCAMVACHTGAGAPFGLDLSAGASAGNLVGVSSQEVLSLLRVEPFNSTDSYLYMKLVNDPRIQADPMPLNRPPLNAGDLALVQSWIDQGAM